MRREPARLPTVALPTPNQTAAPKTAVPGQTRVPTRALVAPTAAPQTATPTDQVRSGLLPRAVESLAASSTMTTTFHPVADAYVDSSHPTVNYGTGTQLRVDKSPIVNSYLRFSVQGLTRTVSRVTLKLYATSSQSTGYTVQAVADNTWTETGITYNNAPAIGTSLGASGPVTANTWTSVDVTSYVTGNGTFSVGLTTSSSTALNLASREAGANAPQLVVETAPPAMETTAIGYSYDPLSRLTGASYSGSSTSTFAYAYDAVGNRTVQTQTITSTLVTTYGYDIANRLTNVNGVTYSWDNNGNLLNDGAKSYGYDQANRLKQVVQGAITTTLAYNGVGDRLSQTVGAATTHYVLDPGAGLTQVLADGTNTYLYGNDRLAQYQAAMQYFGADGLGSVRQIYDASAQVIGNARYDPYGNVMSQGGATSVFTFAGEQQDATGLEYLRARYYSSAQGRFSQPDMTILDLMSPQSLNLYAYVDSNPVRYVDPSGHAPQKPGDPDNMPGDCTTDWCWRNRWFRAHGYEYDTTQGTWVVSNQLPIFYDEPIKDEVIGEAGITLCGQNCQDKTSWTPHRKEVVATGVSLFGLKLSGGVPQLRQLTGGAVKVYVDNKPIYCQRSCAPPPNPTCSGDDIYMESSLLDTQALAYMDVVHELGHIIDWHSVIGGKRFSDAWQGAPITEYAVKSPTPDWDRFAEAVAVYVLGPNYFLRSGQLPTQAGMDIRDQMDRMRRLLEGWG